MSDCVDLRRTAHRGLGSAATAAYVARMGRSAPSSVKPYGIRHAYGQEVCWPKTGRHCPGALSLWWPHMGMWLHCSFRLKSDSTSWLQYSMVPQLSPRYCVPPTGEFGALGATCGWCSSQPETHPYVAKKQLGEQRFPWRHSGQRLPRRVSRQPICYGDNSLRQRWPLL